MKLVHFGSQALRVTDDGLFVAVPDVIHVLGYRDTDALRRRVGEDAIDIHDGLPVVKGAALVALVLRMRKEGHEAAAHWVAEQWGSQADRATLEQRLARRGKVASPTPADHITFEQLCAAMGVRSDNRVTFHNALRVASDVVRSVGLPGFCLGGERFTIDVVGALAVRSVGGARAALTPGRVAALAALSKAVSRGEWIEEEVLAQIREGLDG